MHDRGKRRHTRQRQILLDELRKLHSHPTALELFEITRRRLPRLSLGTVYRNLDLLVRTGSVRRIDAIAGGPARFDADLHQHYHVRCIVCGRVDDVTGVAVELGRARRRIAGYELHGHMLELLGTCPACRKRAASGGRPGVEDGRLSNSTTETKRVREP